MKDAIFIIGIIATVILAIGYVPLTIKVFLTKQTFGISFGFTLFILLATITWVIYGGLLYLDLSQSEDLEDRERALSASLPILISNFILTFLNLINLFIKLSNRRQAKKQNMTEKEYCDSIHQSKLNKKSTRKI